VLRLGAPVHLAATHLAPAEAEEEAPIQLPKSPPPPLPPPPQLPDDAEEDLGSEQLEVESADVEMAIVEAGDCIAAVSDDDVQAIVARAQVVARPRQYTGFVDLVVFSALRRRRLLLRLPDGVIDMVSIFAPNIVNDTWAVVPYHVQLVACRSQDRAWIMSDLFNASHLYAGAPTPPKMSKAPALSRSVCGSALLPVRRRRMATVQWTPYALRTAASDP
jgi:hypothetical protein